MKLADRHRTLLALVLGTGCTIGGVRLLGCGENAPRASLPETSARESAPSYDSYLAEVAKHDPLNAPRASVVRSAPSDSFDYGSFYETLRRHEGTRHTAYLDSEGIITIGVGYNLQKDGARERIAALGLDYDAVCARKVSLTDNQIDVLFHEDGLRALADAQTYVGDTDWDELDPRAQDVIGNMAFNLGATRLTGFFKLRAAYEMENSRGYHQVPTRAQELIERMRSLQK